MTEETKCPFAVGDRIREISSGDEATVTSVGEDSFEYRYDKPIPFHPFLGSFVGGECYRSGFHLYERVPPPRRRGDDRG